MKLESPPEWPVGREAALELQRRLAGQVLRQGDAAGGRYIAGVDISVRRFPEIAASAVVVLEYPGLRPVEIKVALGKPGFPYIPGLLSFREAPLMLEACRQLEITPDLIMVDGQGIAHPRRLGLASHLGLLLDLPAIGCAKSRLCGTHLAPADWPGSATALLEGSEIIGKVLRTRRGVRPLYVSIGHRISLDPAVRMVLDCCRGYRLPEPVRLAHLAAGSASRDPAGLAPALP